MTESPSAAKESEQTAMWGCCRRSTCRLILLLLFFVAYLCAGAVIFMLIEHSAEKNELINLRKRIDDFLANNSCISEASLNTLLKSVVSASDRGVTLRYTDVREKHPAPKNWEFGQSLFFSMTVVTTIGYGRTTPLSQWGKGFCLIYALVGIPLMMFVFSVLLERIYLPTRAILEWMQLKFLGKCSGLSIRLSHLLLAGLLIIVLFIFLPAIVFDYLESKWNYLDSVYYCFISLTTIGLGDFIPGEESNRKYQTVYKILTTIYLFLGLIAMLFILQIFKDVPELDLGKKISTTSDKEGTECKSLNDDFLSSKSYLSTTEEIK